jgi:hypothetical protein
MINDTDLYQVYTEYTNSYLDISIENKLYSTQLYDNINKHLYT